jgi:hypothetical protein
LYVGNGILSFSLASYLQNQSEDKQRNIWETVMNEEARIMSKRKKRKSFPESEQLHSVIFQGNSFSRDEQYISDMHKFEQRRRNYHDNLSTFQDEMMRSHRDFADSSIFDDAINYLVSRQHEELHRISDNVAVQHKNRRDVQMSIEAERASSTKLWRCHGRLNEEPTSEWASPKVLASSQRQQYMPSMTNESLNVVQQLQSSGNASLDKFEYASSASEATGQNRRYKEMRQKLSHIANETRRVSASLAQVVATHQLGSLASHQTQQSQWPLTDTGPLNLDQSTANENERNYFDHVISNGLAHEEYGYGPASWLPVGSSRRSTRPSNPHGIYHSIGPLSQQHFLSSSVHFSDLASFEDHATPSNFSPPHTIHKQSPVSNVTAADVDVTKYVAEMASAAGDVCRIDDPNAFDPRFGMASPDLSSSDDPMP